MTTKINKDWITGTGFKIAAVCIAHSVPV
jgi:hypothetical protein